MAFEIDLAGGFFDIPDSAWTAGNVATEDLLVALNSMVRFAATCDEYFATPHQANGDTIALPQSADDGYAYSRSECLYAAAMNYSPDVNTGVNGGNGDILYTYDYVEQDTGVVSSSVNYYVQGGQDSNAKDGATVAIICCRRGAGHMTDQPGTPGAPVGPTGGGPAGGGGNPNSGGRTPYGPLGQQGGQGDPILHGKGVLIRL